MKMKLTSSTKLMILAVILTLGATTTVTLAQQTATCAQKLIPCADYLNGTKTPSTECCSSIKEAVANDRACLCNLYTTPGLLESFGVNITQALKLTQQCGASTDTSICKDYAPAPAGSTTSPTTPAGVPGNDATNNNGAAAWNMMIMMMISVFLIVSSSPLFH